MKNSLRIVEEMNKKRGHKKDISLNVYTLLSIEKAHDNLKL